MRVYPLSLLELVIMFTVLTGVLHSDEINWNKLSKEQRSIAREVYNLSKPYGLELTLVAIAWQESRLGLVPINLQDPSCGVHHINVKTYLNLHKLKDTSYNRNWYCNRLISDLQLSTSTALEVLIWYRNYHKGDYAKMVKSYNAGFNTRLKQADRYYQDVYHNVRILEGLRHQLESSH